MTSILLELAPGVRLKAPAVAKHLDCSPKTAQRDLTALKDEGRIEYVGAARTGYRSLVPATEKRLTIMPKFAEPELPQGFARLATEPYRAEPQTTVRTKDSHPGFRKAPENGYFQGFFAAQGIRYDPL